MIVPSPNMIGSVSVNESVSINESYTYNKNKQQVPESNRLGSIRSEKVSTLSPPKTELQSKHLTSQHIN